MLPELLSPAGSFDAAVAAFQFGADAVYLGLPRFSARADADNLTIDRIKVLSAYARTFTPAKKIYITFNTLVKEGEWESALDALEALEDIRPDGVIVQDLGVARLIRERYAHLPLHASTQLAAHNLEGVLALKALGFVRVVLARELSLEEIREIVQKGGTEIEIFIHGALCYSMSGLCLFSSHATGRSGNRGRCAYCCREPFRTDNGSAAIFPFSMKDLALGPILGRVVATGAHSLKIEGRMKSPYYVACVTDYYRRLLDGHAPNPEAAVQDLQTVFSRPWTTLYAEGPHAASPIDPIGIGHRGARIGTIAALFADRSGTRWMRFTSDRALEKHDGLQIDLPSGGKPFGFAILTLRAAGSRSPVISLPKGSEVEVALPPADVPPLQPGLPIFCSASQAVKRAYEPASIRESALAVGHPVAFDVTLAADAVTVTATDTLSPDCTVTVSLPCSLAPSRQPERTPDAVRNAFSRMGGSGWSFAACTCRDPDGLYAPPSLLNDARRQVVERLTALSETRRAEHRQTILTSVSGTSARRLTDDGAQVPSSPHLTLKCDIGQVPDPDFAAADLVVLDIGHRSVPDLLARLRIWRETLGSACPIRPALPLLTRNAESDALDRAVAALQAEGFQEWECAELSGLHRLRRLGAKPVSADWSLYVFNRIAAEALAGLAVESFVLSPEMDAESVETFLPPFANPRPEWLLFQHTPLFISESAPCLPGGPIRQTQSFTDRCGRAFTSLSRNGRWQTLSDRPFCTLDTRWHVRFPYRRIDFSWSPPQVDLPGLWRDLRRGVPPDGAHSANFVRPLL